MSKIFVSDDEISKLIDFISNNNSNEILQKINSYIKEFPADERIYFLRHSLKSSSGDLLGALADIWLCMNVNPQQDIFLEAISKILILDEKKEADINHNFKLKSGERQTSPTIEKIRPDHTARYKLASKLLSGKHGKCSNLSGLDLFCGNGYGSRIIHDQTGARMIGIDGSSDAVILANKSYGNHKTIFLNHLFPFGVHDNSFDFTICYESIEHVEDYQGLLGQVFNSSNGSIFISVPSEENLPYAKNKDFFKFHYRHFTLNDIVELCSQFPSHKLMGVYGQTVYNLDGGVISGLVPLEQMYMRPYYPESQFHVLHLEGLMPS
jgi:hypothetical protein